MTIQELRDATKSMRNGDAFQAQQIDLTNLSESELAFLAICQLLYREENGFATPGETFVCSLIFAYSRHPLTSALITSELAAFEDNYRSAIAGAKKLVQEYMVEFLPKEERLAA
jgi:hypothetical protein